MTRSWRWRHGGKGGYCRRRPPDICHASVSKCVQEALTYADDEQGFAMMANASETGTHSSTSGFLLLPAPKNAGQVLLPLAVPSSSAAPLRRLADDAAPSGRRSPLRRRNRTQQRALIQILPSESMFTPNSRCATLSRQSHAAIAASFARISCCTAAGDCVPSTTTTSSFVRNNSRIGSVFVW
jgi:hypothetical protein